MLCLALLGSPAFGQPYHVELGWSDNSSNEDGFRIERKTGQTGAYALRDTVGANVVTYADTAVQPGVTYCYRVNAFNNAGQSTYTNEVCVQPTVATSASQTPTAGGTSPAPASGGKGGCIIATAAFGSPLAPEVRALREVRDRYLLPYALGREAVDFYYEVSPPIAEAIRESETLRAMTRVALAPIVVWARLALWSPILGLGIAISPLFVGIWLFDRRPWRR